jgi:hypothetical protein
MPFAPELRGAFLYGEGIHGFSKSNGYYMDDLWFYDINGHRWICVYPGANCKNLDLKINKDGFECEKNGDIVPVAQQGHGYEMNTYDTDLKRFVSMPCGHSYWEKELPQRKKWLKEVPKDASPWFYETTTAKWKRHRTETKGPPSGYGDTLIYVPSQKEFIFLHRSQDVWFYNSESNKWREVKAEDPKPPFGIDATSCYDSKRDRICIGGGSYPVAEGSNALWVYDLKKNAWIDPKPKGKPCGGSNSYPTKNAVMVYDPHHDVVLLVRHSAFDDKPSTLGVFVYDPHSNAWIAEFKLPDKLAKDTNPKNGFYDPELGLVFIHSAGDSRENGVIWAYRYKQFKK